MRSRGQGGPGVEAPGAASPRLAHRRRTGAAAAAAPLTHKGPAEPPGPAPLCWAAGGAPPPAAGRRGGGKGPRLGTGGGGGNAPGALRGEHGEVERGGQSPARVPGGFSPASLPLLLLLFLTLRLVRSL